MITLSNCDYCHENFESTRKTQKFCSERCDQRFRHQYGTQINRGHGIASELILAGADGLLIDSADVTKSKVIVFEK